jgi:hypothetical protein
MENDFTSIMLKRSNIELFKIINSSEGDYQEAALTAAINEYQKRNLSSEQINSVEKTIEIQNKVETEKANMPLGTGLKILTFILPALFQIILSGTYKADGYDRKAKELVKFTLYGFCFYGVLILLVLIF